MRLFREIRERRLVPLAAAYLVSGFIALEAVDQLISNEMLAQVAYPVTLILYLFGIPISLVFAWFHGAPGSQSAPRFEITVQAALVVVAVVTTVYVYRSQSARFDLAAQSGLSPTSVAVLYFEDVSPGGDLAPVADGITEAMIEQLSEVRSLDVVSRNGVMPFRSLGLRSDSVARVLGVGTLIEGSVDESRGALRITARLVDGFSGADIERSVIEIPAGQFLAARDSVAGSVSRLLRERLGEDVRLRELRAETSSDEAWALAQRAERLRNEAEDNFEGGGETSISVQSYRQADSLLALAEQADPDWSRPPGARAQVAYRLAWFAFADSDLDLSRQEIRRGFEFAERALGLDPRDPYALEQRGTLSLLDFQLAMAMGEEDEAELDRRLASARADLETAVEEDPALATAHGMLSFMFAGMGDNVQAVISARRALEEDAYLRGAARIYDRLTYAQYELEQFRDSRHWCDEGRGRFPDDYRFVECELWLAATPAAAVDVDTAWRLLAQLDSVVPTSLREYKHGVGLIMVGGVLRNAGLPDSAASVFARVDHSEAADPQRNLFVYEAGIRASTGDLDGSLEALRRWIAATPGSTLGEGEDTHWWWRDLRSRPDFRQLVTRAN